MISKTLLAKSFVALSASSAVGTGALKFFSTKDLSERVNEELRKKFEGKTNGQVLEIAGFKDASTDKEILKKSLELRLTSEKVKDDLVDKIAKLCEEGMKASFEGITEVYKTLATVCSRTILLESKVQRDNLRLSRQTDISEKLNQITDKHRERKFIGSLEKETVEELVKACGRFGSKDVFSYEVSKEELADFMTFCVEEKPSVIRFWTGVENPSNIVDYWIKVEAEEKAKQEELTRQRTEQENRAKEEQARREKEAEQQRLAAAEEEKQKEKLAEEQRAEEAKRQAEAQRQLEEKQRKEEEERAAALRAQQEAAERQKQAEAQKKVDAEAAKKRIASLGFKINEGVDECENQLHKFKEGDNLRDMVKVCYKNKKFSDRARELKFSLLVEKLGDLSDWWNDAKTPISKIVSGVDKDGEWSAEVKKVEDYCSSSDKAVNENISDEDWKNYLAACTMKGYLYDDSGDKAVSKKIRSRSFWSTEALFE